MSEFNEEHVTVHRADPGFTRESFTRTNPYY